MHDLCSTAIVVRCVFLYFIIIFYPLKRIRLFIASVVSHVAIYKKKHKMLCVTKLSFRIFVQIVLSQFSVLATCIKIGWKPINFRRALKITINLSMLHGTQDTKLPGNYY